MRQEANELKSDESPEAKVEKLENEARIQQGPVVVRSGNSIGERESKQPRISQGKDSKLPTLAVLAGESGRKLLQAQVDLAVVNLVCAACLPPTLLDYPEWKKVQSLLNTRYIPVSSTTLVDDQIPGQAAHVRKLTIAYLKTQFDLTVSYDGATTKKPQSVYTVSFTTPDGRSFLIEGNQASDESHTGEHISRVLLAAMDLVGRQRFSGISGDSTGNTRVARQLVCNIVATLINMPDVCHHTSLACKDICRLPMFEEVRELCCIRLRGF